MPEKKVLVYGYGNPGRQDDGLGIVMADTIQEWASEKGYNSLEIDQNYQLNIEDANRIMGFDLVVFVDASVEDIETYLLEEVIPDLKTEFTMHSVSTSFVLGLCMEMSETHPQVFQLHIKGYEFEFMKEMTRKAKENLKSAENYLKEFLIKNFSS